MSSNHSSGNNEGMIINVLSKYMNHFAPLYDNFIIMGDFNADPLDNEMREFCDIYNLKNLVKEPTRYKNVANPTCIDLILTNRQFMFHNKKTIETGLSDFHKMTVTVLKTYFKKGHPKIISYRDYKTFSHVSFRHELEKTLSQHNIFQISNDAFVEICMDIFSKHAPLKFKYVRANQGPFMTTKLRKAVMTRSKLRNILNKDKNIAAISAYKRQRNLCTSLFRKAKRDYYSNLNPTCVSDNKTFWKTVKPLFSEKVFSSETITLVDKNVIYEEDNKVSEMFNDSFSSVVRNLNIEINCNLLNETEDETDLISRIIKKYESHPGILKIREVCEGTDTLCFEHTAYENLYNEILLLNPSKACPKDSIPPNVIKHHCDIFALKLHIDFNISIDTGIFPTNLKLADITPVHKKGDRTDKTEYRPVSILPAISKVFEKLLFHQINDFMNPKLSQNQCGFRKGFSAQHCLILMLEN